MREYLKDNLDFNVVSINATEGIVFIEFLGQQHSLYYDSLEPEYVELFIDQAKSDIVKNIILDFHQAILEEGKILQIVVVNPETTELEMKIIEAYTSVEQL